MVRYNTKIIKEGSSGNLRAIRTEVEKIIYI